MSVAVDFKDVDIIFGKDIPEALRMVDAGANRADGSGGKGAEDSDAAARGAAAW